MSGTRPGIAGPLFVACLTAATQLPAAPPSIDFDRDIRPLLSDHCYQCHGPDDDQRQAELRLDTREGLLGTAPETGVVVPGQPDESRLWRRVTSTDADQRMPPASAKRPLEPAQIALLEQWIRQGADWQQHWSFRRIRRPQVPEGADSNWARDPLDTFVAARLAGTTLAPSREATKEVLLRRVTLDLTGLPPSPSDVSEFLADTRPGAYERAVDRLLASPAFGERMARQWLDAARYADTSGYQNDGPREMWRWRDWVIDAYNAGMPFDQFTMEQLAGDLLPHRTRPQWIATGFNRNHRGNSEGGVIPEEFQVEYVVDRVETTSTVWLGLTLGCARCHEHKFDPFTQREFYQLYAYFNNVPEHGRAIKEGNSPPYIQAPTRLQQRREAQLAAQLREAQQQLESLSEEREAAQRAWERELVPQPGMDWLPDEGLAVHQPLDSPHVENDADSGVQLSGEQPAAVDGPRGGALSFDGQQVVQLGDVANFGYFDAFSIAAWAAPRAPGGTIVSRMTDVPQGDGYYVQVQDGHLHVNLVKRWLDDSIRVRTSEPLQADAWTHITVTYDGSRVAKGITVYLNGRPARLHVELDGINQSFAAKAPVRIGGGGGPAGRFHGRLDDVRIYDRSLAPTEALILATTESIGHIAKLPPGKRPDGQRAKLDRYYLEQQAPQHVRAAHQLVRKRQRALEQLTATFPTVMVMDERAERRPTFILGRGQYDQPGERVEPGVPAALPELPSGLPNNRLGLAAWMVSPDHPLTARVAVNRYWQLLFGTGLVKTSEDFGSQGERPTHPDLLDWLAAEFIAHDWDVKAALRSIVCSATYRQSSVVSAAAQAVDPENRMLARGPRLRLPAEVVRDQALAAAGLLTPQLGGPSVRPYQPGDLWKDVATVSQYEQDHGSDLYRRSLYIYWKRTVVPPTMAAFDASPREMCSVRLRRTNTPLQALTLMNETSFVEAARVLAQRVLGRVEQEPERLRAVFVRVLGRAPDDREAEALAASLARQRDYFSRNVEAAEQLLEVGEYPCDPELDAAELASYTVVASLVLNLDETVTKQ